MRTRCKKLTSGRAWSLQWLLAGASACATTRDRSKEAYRGSTYSVGEKNVRSCYIQAWYGNTKISICILWKLILWIHKFNDISIFEWHSFIYTFAWAWRGRIIILTKNSVREWATHMGARSFFPGMGKLGVWGRKYPNGSKDRAPVGVWGPLPPEADDRLWK